MESIATKAAHAYRIIGSHNLFRAMAGWQRGLNPVALGEKKHSLERFLFALVSCKIKRLPAEEAHSLVRAFLLPHISK